MHIYEVMMPSYYQTSKNDSWMRKIGLINLMKGGWYAIKNFQPDSQGQVSSSRLI